MAAAIREINGIYWSWLCPGRAVRPPHLRLPSTHPPTLLPSLLRSCSSSNMQKSKQKCVPFFCSYAKMKHRKGMNPGPKCHSVPALGPSFPSTDVSTLLKSRSTGVLLRTGSAWAHTQLPAAPLRSPKEMVTQVPPGEAEASGARVPAHRGSRMARRFMNRSTQGREGILRKAGFACPQQGRR